MDYSSKERVSIFGVAIQGDIFSISFPIRKSRILVSSFVCFSDTRQQDRPFYYE